MSWPMLRSSHLDPARHRSGSSCPGRTPCRRTRTRFAVSSDEPGLERGDAGVVERPRSIGGETIRCYDQFVLQYIARPPTPALANIVEYVWASQGAPAHARE